MIFRTRTILSLLAALLAMLILVACGGNNTYSPTVNSGGPPPVVAISITPTTASTTPGGTVQYTAHVTGTDNTAVTWSVVEDGGGSITQTGLYTAPGGLPVSGGASAKPKLNKAAAKWADDSSATYTIKAVSQADPTKSATATVTVAAAAQAVTVTITPNPAYTFPGGSVQLTAHVTGSTNTAVTWSITSGTGGTITQTGLFTAEGYDEIRPKSAKREAFTESYTVKATSVADPTKSATTSVTATDLQIAVTPQNPTVVVNQQITFTAAVTGATTNKNVTWVADDGGTITQAGVYTAPSKPGGYQILAESQAQPGLEAYSDITVVAAQNVTISISPKSTTIAPGAGILLYPIVNGTTNTAVTWSLAYNVYGGSISQSGYFQAPSTTNGNSTSFTVTATSVADPTKSATATIYVTPGPLP